jgi:hypothetical protein
VDTKRFGTPVIYVVLVAVLAYFEYGKTLDALLGGLLLAMLLAIVSLFGLVPFAGVLLYLLVADAALKWFSDFTGLPNTGLTVAVAFWLAAVGAVVLNIAVSLIAYKLIRR